MLYPPCHMTSNKEVSLHSANEANANIGSKPPTGGFHINKKVPLQLAETLHSPLRNYPGFHLHERTNLDLTR